MVPAATSGSKMLSVDDALASLELAAEMPSMETFISTAERIRKEKTIGHANHLHMHICNNGLDSYKALGNCVVRMLADCGGISCAHQVFDKLSYQDEFSWTSLMQGHIEYGEAHHAFNLFHEMQDSCVHPSRFTFVALLKACVKLKCVDRGRVLHVEITKEGCEADLSVGSTLVEMYSKCGALAEAQEVFERLPVRDVVLWTTLMIGFVECGLGERALDCLEEMHSEGVLPDAVTYVCSLKACGSIGDVELGRELYGEIVKGGFGRDPFVGNALVAMYAKCGLLGEAHEVFDRLPCQNVVSWNSLINGYAEHGLYEDALNCLENMNLEDMAPTSVTFVGGLKACGGVGAIYRGRELHAQIVKEEFEQNLPVGNALVAMYAKCGSLVEARDMFDNLPIQDVVSWTALIAGYAEHGHDEEALDCFERMQWEGVPLDAPTYVCGLKASASIRALHKGLELHTGIATEGFETEGFVSNTLVDVYAKCGSLAEAQEVFESMLDRDVVSWNVLIAGYAEHGLGAKALNCLQQMQGEGVSPNAVTYICSLKACGTVGAIIKGQEVHAEIVEEGYERDSFVGNTIMDMYLKCGDLVDAQGVFDELPIRDAVSWTALLTGYAEHGLGDAALNCFQQMQVEGLLPDAVSWDALILGCAEQGESEAVFKFYAQMQEQGLLPSTATVVSILNACGDIAALRIGRKVHASVYRVGLEAANVTLANALIDMYCRCGNIVEAQQVFEALPARDVVTWNTIITGYSRQGKSDLVFYLLDRMQKDEIKPEGVTFLNALTACNHAGLVEKGRKYFETITVQYATTSIKHHHCMADLLGRAGQVDEAVAMLERMPFQPDLVTWGTMLGACHKWGYLDLGRQAFEGAVRLDQRQSAAFILMSNMFVEAQTWEE